MKRLAILFLLLQLTAHAQPGLERIIVEKYYIADSTDERISNGKLKAGSVTYRIFADLLKGYRLQAVYGIPGHSLFISTTGSFYNNTEYGGVTSNDIPTNALVKSTVMLDSWLSVGAGAEGMYALPKAADTSAALVNLDHILQNKEASSGKSIKDCDGLIPASPVPAVTFFGIDSNQAAFFSKDNSQLSHQIFFTENGSWANFGGAIGCDSSNQVLIAQITTDGQLSFELNLQLGSPNGIIENFVARDPKSNEILNSSLRFSSEEKTISGQLESK